MTIKHSYFLFLISLFAIQCHFPVSQPKKKKLDRIPIEKIQLPDGFKISLFAEGVVNARSLSLSPSGTLFVGTRTEGNVYALKDTDGDFIVDQQYTLLSDGNLPNGVAFKDGDLYIAEVDRILKISDIESKLDNPGTPEVIYDEYPTEKHHGWKFIAFGPDDKLYVPVGAPCNICESEDEIFASMTRIDPDGSNLEVVHSGIRNTVGFTWHPETGDLWFTDNNRDWMGDNMPACELNRAPADGMHFGYPYCHQGDTPDPEFGKKKACSEFTAPAQNLSPHTAPLGCEFLKGSMFPEKYKDFIFIAEHGSWNRSKKIGYRISLVEFDENFGSLGYTNFATGWLDTEENDVWGRPVDLEWMPDGSLLISDDFADAIYRVTYVGS